MYASLPEPFRAALVSGRTADVADAEVHTGQERYARGLARLQCGRDADAREDLSAAVEAMGDAARIELVLLDVRERAHLPSALERAGEIGQRAPEGSLLQARALHSIGLIQGKLREICAAANALTSALEICRDQNAQLLAAQVRDTLGALYASRGMLDLATSHFALSLTEKTLHNDRYGMAISLGNLGRVHLRAGRFLDALDCFRLDLRLAEELGDRRGAARMHEDIGRALLGTGDAEAAEAALRQCLAEARQEGYRDLAFFAHKDLAEALLRQGRMEEAEQQLASARDGLDPRGEPYLETMLLAAEGELELARGETSEAIRTLASAVQRFAEAELPDHEIPALLSLAGALTRVGRKASAEACLRRALAVARADGYARYLPAIREASQAVGLEHGAVEEEGRLLIEDGQPVTTDDGYTILEQLGTGSFGDVYYALDHNRDRYVAIKRLRLEELYDGTPRRRVLTSARVELEAASRIDHRGIARVHAVGTDTQGRTYVVQEFVEGRTLRESIPVDGSASLGEVVAGIRDLASALDELHAHGVIHRDLKPENVILRAKSGRPVLLDFGIAYLPEGGGRTPSTVAGTLEYMAPEQAAGAGVGSAADVYSLGVLFYEWLTGRHPLDLEGRTPTERFLEVRSGTPAPVEERRADLPAGVVRLLNEMLAREPDERPDAGEVFQDCRALLKLLSQPAG